MAKLYLIVAMCLCSSVCTKGQSPAVSVLSGVVIDAETDLPVLDITVFTKFSNTNTDRLGIFNLSLAQCGCQPGDQIILYTLNDSYGYSENKYTLSKGSKQDITLRIFKNPNTIYVNGIVKDKNGFAPIEDIEVKISTGNIPADIADVTGKDGTFRLPIPKKYLGNEKSVRLVYTDPKNRYEQLDEEQRIDAFAKVFLTYNNTVKIQNPEADNRKALTEMGISWKFSNFMETLKERDIMTAALFVRGGMKLNINDFISYFYNYYSDTLTDLFIQYKTVNANMCPLDGFDAPTFYKSASKEQNKAGYVRTICGTEQNIQTLTELIVKEEQKVNLFRQEANKIKRPATCVDEILNGQPLNVDSLFFKMYGEAASRADSLIFGPITYTPREAVLAKLASFLATHNYPTNTAGLEHLKATIKQQCPDLYVLLEADNSYLNKLKQMKVFLTGN
ncbi:MAG: hypothetical protein ICV83_02120 [Cytophagales bacterium]|nr:hypothetical protein [Cytophagales bacterium]